MSSRKASKANWVVFDRASSTPSMMMPKVPALRPWRMLLASVISKLFVISPLSVLSATGLCRPRSSSGSPVSNDICPRQRRLSGDPHGAYKYHLGPFCRQDIVQSWFHESLNREFADVEGLRSLRHLKWLLGSRNDRLERVVIHLGPPTPCLHKLQGDQPDVAYPCG